ncbi:hypothetical protein BV898_05051 [Hypsibius exemplaris]|uniref:E3 ubiquitin-protein ligase RNF220 middle domain-containing protein n=1 Tax=Hypsibius exemplaris TaxID=2072580 RepID=A0A1W0X0H7_HYPEX|nr:hypothetical protein BV898_05051 [Hypsibius exemplaris]
MNNASFHLSAPGGRVVAGSGGGGGGGGGHHHHHSMLLQQLPSSLPNNSSSGGRSGSMPGSADSPFGMAMQQHMQNGGASPPGSQMAAALNFSQQQRDLLHQFGQMSPGFPYMNGFAGMPLMPMGFGMFPQHHHLFAKSPGMMAGMPGFFNNFAVNKEEDLSWNKRSPNSFPDSPRSGSRGSPMENTQLKKKLPKGKVLSDNNICPICQQTVSAKAMQEHFLEELKVYRQEPLSARDVSSSSPTGGRRHGQSTTPAAPSDVDSRHETFLRVRANRRARYNLQSSGEQSSSRRPSSSSDPRSSHSSHRSSHSSSTKLRTPEQTATEEPEVIVDVEGDDEKNDHPPASSHSPQFDSAHFLVSPSGSRRSSVKSPNLVVSRKRMLQDRDGDAVGAQSLQDYRSENLRRRSSSEDESNKN